MVDARVGPDAATLGGGREDPTPQLHVPRQCYTFLATRIEPSVKTTKDLEMLTRYTDPKGSKIVKVLLFFLIPSHP